MTKISNLLLLSSKVKMINTKKLVRFLKLFRISVTPKSYYEYIERRRRLDVWDGRWLYLKHSIYRVIHASIVIIATLYILEYPVRFESPMLERIYTKYALDNKLLFIDFFFLIGFALALDYFLMIHVPLLDEIFNENWIYYLSICEKNLSLKMISQEFSIYKRQAQQLLRNITPMNSSFIKNHSLHIFIRKLYISHLILTISNCYSCKYTYLIA